MALDVGGSGFGVPFNGFPHDWTEGTGVFPAGGVITLSNPALQGMTRRWLFIQNQGNADITVQFNATLADGSTVTTASMILTSGGGAGIAGGTYENFHQLPSLIGIITVTGVAGQKVAVLERLK